MQKTVMFMQNKLVFQAHVSPTSQVITFPQSQSLEKFETPEVVV